MPPIILRREYIRQPLIFWTTRCGWPGEGFGGPAICALTSTWPTKSSASSCTVWAHALVLLLMSFSAPQALADTFTFLFTKP
jgi:hypothetical protein